MRGILKIPPVVALIGAAGLGIVPLKAADWHEVPGGRFQELNIPSRGKAGFSPAPIQLTGNTFSNSVANSRGITNQIYFNGSGVAAGDFNNDGRVDLYFCGLDTPNALYRNLGDWKFEEVAARAGVDCPGLDATAATFADLDGDGLLDLLVNSVGQGTSIFLNAGNGTFRDFTSEAGTRAQSGSMSMTLADVDQDGDLDVYVTNYRQSTLRDEPRTRFRISTQSGTPTITQVNGRPVTERDLIGRFSLGPSGEVLEHGEADVLFLNDGKARFSPVAWTNGNFLDEAGKAITIPFDWGLAAQFRDINLDGRPDLYVCNDFESPDRFWLNRGKGVFQLAPPATLGRTSLFSMGVDFADFDRDGDWDFFVADMLSQRRFNRQVQVGEVKPMGAQSLTRPQFMQNTLQLNQGDGTFVEVAYQHGVEASEWSWCPVFLDVDLDGWEDLLITTGHVRDAQNMDVLNELKRLKAAGQMSSLEELSLRSRFPVLALPKQAFRNEEGARFLEAAKEWGFDQVGIAHGMALADLDGDGDHDLAINQLNSPCLILKNDSPAPRLAVRLSSKSPNTRGIGARLRLSGTGPVQMQEMISGGRYLSADDAMRTFAAFHPTNRFQLEVVWPSGRLSLLTNLAANRLYEIQEEPSVAGTNSPGGNRPSVIFKSNSTALAYPGHRKVASGAAVPVHLSRALEPFGGGISWADLDGDGWEDLIWGDGESVQFSRNEKGILGSPQQLGTNWPAVGSVAVKPADRGQGGLVASLANPSSSTSAAAWSALTRGKPGDVQLLSGGQGNYGAVTFGDLDGDGLLDLFIANRYLRDRYPLPSPSQLFFATAEGRLSKRAGSDAALEKIGLVTGAVFANLLGDPRPELILSTEWGSLKILEWRDGRLNDLSEAYGLAGLKGWWNGVTVGDYNGDGKLDLAASNWGNNSPFRIENGKGPSIYFGTTGSGWEMLEGVVDPENGKSFPLANLKTMAQFWPQLAGRFSTFQQYALTGMAELLEGRTFVSNSINTLVSGIFLNRGNSFEWIPLPAEAQRAPGFGLATGDFNLDGKEDLFLAQNLSTGGPELPPLNSGRGALLLGMGNGHFQAAGPGESGISLAGNQRGAAVCDFNHDGRPDLAVVEFPHLVRILENQIPSPGFRLKLAGPPGNSTGIGAVVRLNLNGRLGPARAITAGSGYWSQDSAVLVFPKSAGLKAIEVHWPDGAKQMETVSEPVDEIIVRHRK